VRFSKGLPRWVCSSNLFLQSVCSKCFRTSIRKEYSGVVGNINFEAIRVSSDCGSKRSSFHSPKSSLYVGLDHTVKKKEAANLVTSWTIGGARCPKGRVTTITEPEGMN